MSLYSRGGMSDTIRPFDLADQSAVIKLLAESMPTEAIAESRFVRQVLLDGNFRGEGAPVAERNGKVVGFCLSVARQMPLENAPPDSDRGYITLFAVAPEAQRNGIGTKLLAAAEDYLKSQQRSTCMIASYAPGYFIPGVDVSAYAGALDFLKKRGYSEVYRPVAMKTMLAEVTTPAWVNERREKLAAEGVKVEPFSAEMATAVVKFAKREFAGDWVRMVKEVMGAILLGASAKRLLVARERGEVVGFSHYDRNRFGPIGVSTSQRGRGVGQVLMFETLAAQREEGHEFAYFLWSDDKTAARLYGGAGFKEFRRFAVMKKALV
jgi:mycothiol synthase